MKLSADLEVRLNRAQQIGLAFGLMGLIACVVGALAVPQQFFPAYLFAYVFWVGMSLGCLAIVLLHHLVHGSWGYPIQRIAEAGAMTLPVMAVLFVPIALGLPVLYPWARPALVATDPILQAKQPYLNVPFFLLRTVIYFVVWLVLLFAIARLASRYEEDKDAKTLYRLRTGSALGLVAFALTVTFTLIDWIMSLEPHWFSTIYGAMVAMAQVLGAFALVIALVVWLARFPPLSAAVSRRTLTDLGGLLLAFVMLWAYLAFSQYMLIWAGNLAEEVPWYLRRVRNGWEAVALAVVMFQFFLPFFLLVSRDVKRNGRRLAGVAIFLVVMRLIDTYWLVIPGTQVDAAPLRLHWLDPVAVAAVGGFWVALFVWRLKRQPLLPANAPAVPAQQVVSSHVGSQAE